MLGVHVWRGCVCEYSIVTVSIPVVYIVCRRGGVRHMYVVLIDLWACGYEYISVCTMHCSNAIEL